MKHHLQDDLPTGSLVEVRGWPGEVTVTDAYSIALRLYANKSEGIGITPPYTDFFGVDENGNVIEFPSYEITNVVEEHYE